MAGAGAGHATIFQSYDFNTQSLDTGLASFQENGNYNEEWVSSSGFNGTGTRRLLMFQGQSQFPMGWYFYGANGHTWTWNDVAYIRFRVRFDDNYRWDGQGSQQNKLLDFGANSSRIILHNERDNPSTPCGLKNIDYSVSSQPMSNTEEDYGLPIGAFDGGDWGSLAIKRGIDEPCTPPVIVSHGVWYHVQLAIKVSSSSAASDGYFKLWLNNNDISNPSTQIMNVVQGLEDWNSSWTLGGYWTDANPYRNQGWVIDDLVVADQFDPNWATPESQDIQQNTLPVTTTSDFFTEDFEAVNWNRWVGTPAGNLQIVNDNCAEGTYCARASLVADTNDNNYADYIFGDHTNVGDAKVEEVYMQMYSKISTGYQWPNNSHKIAIFNLTDGVSTQRRYQVYVYADANGRYVVDYSDIGDWTFSALTQNVGTPVNVSPGQWDKLKLRVRLNTPGVADGIVELWVNDELKLSYNNVNIRENTAYGINKFILSSYSTDATGGNGTQWYDEVRISTSDIGGTSAKVPQAPVLSVE